MQHFSRFCINYITSEYYKQSGEMNATKYDSSLNMNNIHRYTH